MRFGTQPFGVRGRIYGELFFISIVTIIAIITANTIIITTILSLLWLLLFILFLQGLDSRLELGRAGVEWLLRSFCGLHASVLTENI